MDKLNIEYYEYDCGFPCTEDGCLGHETDIPIAFELNGIRFDILNSRGGDFPSSDKEEIQRVKDTMEFLRSQYEKLKEVDEQLLVTIKELKDEITTLIKENERLREALKMFEEYSSWGEHKHTCFDRTAP